ncbi:MAG TPA: TolC family protein [Desulfuromonadaceae bacterium]|jgi:HAE1 family hydrophobic/amphiphilic exporter-1
MLKRKLLLPLSLFSVLSAVFGAGGSIAYAAELRTLTLDQALSIALDKNRDIAKARQYSNYVQGRYIEERAAALPQVGLNGSVALAQDDSQRALLALAPRQYTRAVDLVFSQPLYTWGKINAAIRGAEVGLKTADEQLRLYRQAAWREVSGAFYDVLLAKELFLAASENQVQKKRLLDEAQRRYAAGVATDYDVLSAEVAVENSHPAVIRSEHAIRTTRERLRFLLAMEDQEVDVIGTLETALEPPQPYEQALVIARQRRPELNDLRYRVGIYQELVTIAAAENKPRLDLKGGLGWHWLEVKDGSTQSADGLAWNVGLLLSFPFFDGLKTTGKVIQAKSDLATKQIEEAKLLDSIALDVRDAGNAVKEAVEIVQALAGTVRQAARLAQMAEKGFELGVKIRLEVDDAQLNLLQAKSNLARGQRDYRVARVNYQWAMGIAGE